MLVICDHCDNETEKGTGHVNRSRKIGAHLFCNRICAGAHKRKEISVEQKKAAKRLYDMEYRAKNLASIKAKKAARFKHSYDPKKAAIERKKNMARHVEYCQRPEYKAWKVEYDRRYRAKTDYGEFAEAFLALQDIEKEVAARVTRYEIYQTNGTINKHQKRKRDYERLISNKS